MDVTQWDFAADLDRLLAGLRQGDGPQSMSGMVENAGALVEQARGDDPEQLARWLDDNAVPLVAQQLLIATVHAEQSPATELPHVVREWAAAREATAADAVAWLKEEHPGLLRAWLLGRVEELVAELLVAG